MLKSLIIVRHRTLITRLLVCLMLLEPAARLYMAVFDAQPVRAVASGPELRYADGIAIWGNYSSPDLNIQDGARRTIGQPTRHQHTLWLYGNSVTYGLFVPDSDTIASRLQVLVPNWRVVNLSTSGQAVRGQLAWLKLTPVQPDDMVVFVDGFTESWYAEQKAIPVANWLLLECAKPQGQRAIVTVFAVTCALMPRLSLDETVLKAVTDDYMQTIAEVQRYTAQRSVNFYHFLQPGLSRRFSTMGTRLEGLRLEVPTEDYIDINLHINRAGAVIVAQSIYNALTIF